MVLADGTGMKTTTTCWLIPLVTVLLLAGRGEAADHIAEVRFGGKSTLHDFEGHGQSAPFEIEVKPGAETEMFSARVSVPVMSLDTQNEKRDHEMLNLLDRDAFPVIEGELLRIPVKAPDGTSVELTLRLHGREQAVPAVLTDMRREGDHLSFHLSFIVSLAQYGLKPPSVMGLIRVADAVQVECEVQPMGAKL